MPEITEAAVFELKLRIQHQQEKIEYLAGGTTGAEIIDALMEKQDELEENFEKLRKAEEEIANTEKRAKRIDAKRRELVAENERLILRCQVFEKELDGQLSISGDLRKEVADTKGEIAAVEERLRENEADHAAAEESALANLNAARSEASSLQEMVEQQRGTISEIGAVKKGLEDTVARKEDAIKSLEQRKKDISQRSREIKTNLENLLSDSQKSQADLAGQRNALENELHRIRRRLEERTKIAMEEERKATNLARELGAAGTKLEAVRQDLASANEEIGAMRDSRQEGENALMVLDKKNNQLRRENDGLKKEIENCLQRFNKEKQDLSTKLEDGKKRFEAMEATLCNQMKRMEDDSCTVAESQEERITVFEAELFNSREKCKRLEAESSALREEISNKAKQIDRKQKAEARQRARLQDTTSRQEEQIRQLIAELTTARQQGVDMRHLEAENKELKSRIERQEGFEKRRMDKERRARSRSRSLVRSSVGGVSEKGGRTSGNLVPLPPLMNDRTKSIDGNHEEGDAGIDGNSHGNEFALQAISSSSSDVKRAGGDSAGGGGGSTRRDMRSQSPFTRTAGASSSRGSANVSSTPESASRVVGKENSARVRRAAAGNSRSGERGVGVDNNGGSGSSSRRSRDRKIDRIAGGESVKHASGICKSGSGEGRLRGRAESSGMMVEGGARSRPPESMTVLSVKRPSTVGAREVAHENPRGRRPEETKAPLQRPSCEKQTRSSAGWR